MVGTTNNFGLITPLEIINIIIYFSYIFMREWWEILLKFLASHDFIRNNLIASEKFWHSNENIIIEITRYHEKRWWSGNHIECISISESCSCSKQSNTYLYFMIYYLHCIQTLKYNFPKISTLIGKEISLCHQKTMYQIWYSGSANFCYIWSL